MITAIKKRRVIIKKTCEARYNIMKKIEPLPTQARATFGNMSAIKINNADFFIKIS
jgi:hypothetical protein